MARPSERNGVDLTKAHDLTGALIDRLQCPPGKKQAFLRDKECPGLRVRVTASGAKAFVFERWVNGATMRTTIGPASGGGIQDARHAADKLRVLVRDGLDPRNVKRDRQRAAAEQRAANAAEKARDALTVRDAWTSYIAARKAATKGGKPVWGALHRRDHERMAQAGGQPAERGTRGRGVTIAGPLYPLMGLRLRDLTAERIREWAKAPHAPRPR